jgi:hypothetical protein
MKSEEIGQRYLLTYSFYGDNLPSEELGDKLGVKPEAICKKGEYLNNNPKSAKNITTSWHSPRLSGDRPNDFYTDIKTILAIFEKQDSYIIDLITNKAVKIYLYATLTGGPGVTEIILPSLWKKLDRYQITFQLDSCI